MSNVTFINQKTRIESGVPKIDQQIRHSIRQHCQLQFAAMCNDFFDATDDFLFASGSKGQFAEDSAYLKAMRELRTKQSLFESAFLEITTTTLFSGTSAASRSDFGNSRHLVERHAEIYQMLEVDLALQAMQRKSEKSYAVLNQRVDALLSQAIASNSAMSFRFAPVASSLWAFGEAQRLFALPLDIRLVVIKLFEQHFMLQLEKLFTDVIGLIKSALVKSAEQQPELTESGQLGNHGLRNAVPESCMEEIARPVEPGGSMTQSIELAVDAAVTSQTARPDIPAFIAEMLRCKWRTVLFLIGMHRGSFGVEWREATTAMQLLVDCAAGQCEIDKQTLDELLEQLLSGFELLQMPAMEQRQFEQQVRACWQKQVKVSDADNPFAAEQKISDVARDIPAESSLSPSGKKILDSADLEELTSLLGAENENISKSAMERELLDCLPEIDGLKEEMNVEYKIEGNFQSCSLRKSQAKPDMFNITDCHTKTTITRSRLGLAISLHEGELKLPKDAARPVSSQKTVIDTASNRAVH